MADTLVAHGLEVPLLDSNTQSQIAALLPSYGSAANPVDLTASAVGKAGNGRFIEILQRSPSIDSVVIAGSLTIAHADDDDRLTLERVASHPDKPVLLCSYTLPSEAAVREASMLGIPVFTNMPDCAGALSAMVNYRSFLDLWRHSDPRL
jgi:acetyltransferase